MLRIRFEATHLAKLLVYVVVIVAALSLADWRLREEVKAAPFAAPVEATFETPKPFFSLGTTRTYSTGENARLWLAYRGISSLDFRVYRIDDPAKFFARLNNPHQMGKDEEEQITSNFSRNPSLLERMRAVKSWAYSGVRHYLRSQLKNTRRSLHQKFRATGANNRTPLNVADYARVPLLNQNQLVTTWREPLATLETEYDRRLVPLGKREPGVYLVEAVNEELRAYTIVVVTDLAMVEKSSPNGDLLVYAVDRQTGAPRSDAQVEIVKNRQTWPRAAQTRRESFARRSHARLTKKTREIPSLDEPVTRA